MMQSVPSSHYRVAELVATARLALHLVETRRDGTSTLCSISAQDVA